MRAAPAVSVDASDNGPGRAVVVMLVALAVAVAIRWAWSWLGVAWEPLARLQGSGFALTVAGAWAAGLWAWRRAGSAAVRLSWDGALWLWREEGSDPVPGRAAVVFDLGRWVLVVFDPTPGEAGSCGGGRRGWGGPLVAGRGRRWRLLGARATRALRVALFAALPTATPRAAP